MCFASPTNTTYRLEHNINRLRAVLCKEQLLRNTEHRLHTLPLSSAISKTGAQTNLHSKCLQSMSDVAQYYIGLRTSTKTVWCIGVVIIGPFIQDKQLHDSGQDKLWDCLHPPPHVKLHYTRNFDKEVRYSEQRSLIPWLASSRTKNSTIQVGTKFGLVCIPSTS